MYLMLLNVRIHECFEHGHSGFTALFSVIWIKSRSPFSETRYVVEESVNLLVGKPESPPLLNSHLSSRIVMFILLPESFAESFFIFIYCPQPQTATPPLKWLLFYRRGNASKHLKLYTNYHFIYKRSCTS